MSVTNAELREAVAEELGVKSVGLALSAEDATYIDTRITRILAWLDTEGLVYWPDDEIPEEAVEPLAMIVATRCATGFGRDYTLGAEGMIGLRKLAAARKSENPICADYF